MENESGDGFFANVIMQKLGEFFPGVVGVETMNKYGEVTKKHMHYDFMYPADGKATKTWIEKLKKRIQRANKESEKPRNTGYYSLTVQDVQDYDRWYRYCIKQVETFDQIIRHPRIPPPSDFDMAVQWKLANEEWKRDVEFLSKRRETADKRQTTLQKIIDLASEKVFPTVRSVFDFVLQYYKDEVIPMERLKMRAIIDTLCVRYNLITEDEWFRQVMH